jgi:hypothetical protein
VGYELFDLLANDVLSAADEDRIPINLLNGIRVGDEGVIAVVIDGANAPGWTAFTGVGDCESYGLEFLEEAFSFNGGHGS